VTSLFMPMSVPTTIKRLISAITEHERTLRLGDFLMLAFGMVVELT
jgi:uncharacterized protein YjeT (DUF2065 family)